LELTKTIESGKMHPQFLDMMDIEKERGITIKMQPVRMKYLFEGKEYVLNLIDTPGHADFSYEVSRSLAAVEGAILMVDAAKGIQAQTLSNLEMAKNQNLVLIPVINKIDLPQANIEEVEKEISELLNISPEEIIKISAKEGTNVKNVLDSVVEKIPPPKTSKGEFRSLVFDSNYDSFKGVIAFVRVFGGEIKKGDEINFLKLEEKSISKEVGVFSPLLTPSDSLCSGEIGYIATGLKDARKVRVGDTISSGGFSEALPGYKKSSPMVFLSIYPKDPNSFEVLKGGLEKLVLNDASLSVNPEMRAGLGRGFRCGFLGLLHAEVITERLRREYGLDLVLSTPSVLSKVSIKGEISFLHSANDWPENPSSIEKSWEQWVSLKVMTPSNYLGNVLKLLESIDSSHLETKYVTSEKVELVYETPLREIVSKNFYDKLKSVSQGFASMSYRFIGWRESDLVKLDILILGEREEAFSKIIPRKDASKEGRRIVKKLKEVLNPELFSLPLQAAVYGKIIARETLKARRKDVTASLYGGDYSRKRKLLQNQRKKKGKLKERGKVRIPQEAYFKVLE
jgi:GTP-binding protein LepA